MPAGLAGVGGSSLFLPDPYHFSHQKVEILPAAAVVGDGHVQAVHVIYDNKAVLQEAESFLEGL